MTGPEIAAVVAFSILVGIGCALTLWVMHDRGDL